MTTETDTSNVQGSWPRWVLGPLAVMGLLASSACAQEADDLVTDDPIVGEEAVEAETTNYDVDGDGQLDLEAMLAEAEARRAESAEELAREMEETVALLEIMAATDAALEPENDPDDDGSREEARRDAEERLETARERAVAARERADAARQALEADDDND